MSTTVGRFPCKNCGKTFSWKPAIAGKKAKCSCGASVEVPAVDPAAVQVSAGDSQGSVFHVKPDEEFDHKKKAPVVGPPCPSCNVPLPAPNSILCTACGYNTKTKKKPGSGAWSSPTVRIVANVLAFIFGAAAALYLMNLAGCFK
jgi:hypothetical protein